jgi:plasmid replication initiation protein
MARGLSASDEREKLDRFIVATGDASPRDQRDLMERPFFSLAKMKRVTPILYEAGEEDGRTGRRTHHSGGGATLLSRHAGDPRAAAG